MDTPFVSSKIKGSKATKLERNVSPRLLPGESVWFVGLCLNIKDPMDTLVVTNARSRQSGTSRDGSTVAMLADLPVKGRPPMTSYEREALGPDWLDADSNGCDIRTDVLADSLSAATFKPVTGRCLVLTRTLDDPYTGREINYAYGDGNLVDVDHVVALDNARATGLVSGALSNVRDPLDLLAIDAGENRSKGDGDAATWLPPEKDFRCDYVARQIAVKVQVPSLGHPRRSWPP